MRNRSLTIREVARQLPNAGAAPVIAGTPSDIADELEACFKAGAADGFNLIFPVLPVDLFEFAQLVIPELQRRGIAQTKYGSGTFRKKPGLLRPANTFG
jgi:alkanesulfonate monooxygenase SsuD/methylene tetrahydromethanopterin reductase-like flavin-dependent oxidoreductase (luciferase family)